VGLEELRATGDLQSLNVKQSRFTSGERVRWRLALRDSEGGSLCRGSITKVSSGFVFVTYSIQEDITGKVFVGIPEGVIAPFSVLDELAEIE